MGALGASTAPVQPLVSATIMVPRTRMQRTGPATREMIATELAGVVPTRADHRFSLLLIAHRPDHGPQNSSSPNS